jgi:hypothetical protein
MEGAVSEVDDEGEIGKDASQLRPELDASISVTTGWD